MNLGRAGRRRVRGGKMKSQRGTNLVEQALTITFLCSIMFGIIDCARLMYAYHFVANAAREASRYASVRSASSGTPVNNGNLQSLVRTVPGMGLDSNQLSTTTNYLPPPHGSPSCPAPGPPSNKPGCMVQVQVTYNYSFILPLLPSAGVTMKSTSETLITE
jgi:hypothetical protein